MPKTTRVKLKNGLTILHAYLPESVTTTMAIFVRAGSEYETKRENGISHFLEHMCFRGSERYPNHATVAEAFEILGVTPEAFTANEYTYYYAKAANKDFAASAKILFDVVRNPLFNTAEISKEKGVVIEEMNMNDDDPQSLAWDRFHETLYLGESAGRRILGTKANIREFSRRDLLAYHRFRYVPRNLVVSVAGKVPLALVRKQVAAAFQNVLQKEVIFPQKAGRFQKEFRESILRKDSNQTSFVLGFRAFPVSDKRRYALRILEGVLGGTESSRLWRKIYGEMGAAYNVGAVSVLRSKHGYFAISGGIETRKFLSVLRAIRKELRSISKNGISAEEFSKIRKYIIARERIKNETSEDWALSLGEQEIVHGELEPSEKAISKYESVSRREIRELAKDVFKNEHMTLSVVGPLKNTTFSKEILM